MECLKSWMGCWWSNLSSEGASDGSMTPHLFSRDTVFQRSIHLMNERQELVHLNSWMTAVDERHRMTQPHVNQMKDLMIRYEDLSKRYEELSHRLEELSLRVENDDLVIVTTET